ncbi:MAG: SPOR domain-containing protein [Asticcacaulis sp.]
MSENEPNDRDRGTYSPPTEDNLSYEPRRRVPSRDKAPITLIISGVCLVILLLVVVVAFSSGIGRQSKIAPDVGESLTDIKEGQVQDAKPLSEEDVASDTGAAVFAPGSETPALRPSATVDVAPAPVAPITGPLPSQAGNSAIAPAAAPQGVSVASSSSASAASKSPATPQVTAPAKPATAAPAAATGSASVQIGAYATPEIANSEYAKVASSYGLFVGGAGKRVEKVTTANGTFYRTAFTGMSAEKAKNFCSALKAAGRDCLIK